jgi:hypothetical protein
MDHETMRASQLPVHGPAATETLAASGGLELPGHVGEGVTPELEAESAEVQRTMTPPTLASLEKIEHANEPDAKQESR